MDKTLLPVMMGLPQVQSIKPFDSDAGNSPKFNCSNYFGRKHYLFLSAFPGNPSPPTGIKFCEVSPSTNATQVRHTVLPS